MMMRLKKASCLFLELQHKIMGKGSKRNGKDRRKGKEWKHEKVKERNEKER